jgi:hypothetical protein
MRRHAVSVPDSGGDYTFAAESVLDEIESGLGALAGGGFWAKKARRRRKLRSFAAPVDPTVHEVLTACESSSSRTRPE